MKVINLYGGPSTGKSTIASQLFAEMKWRKINIELVNEYAKDLVWDKRFHMLKDQMYISAKQNRKLARLKNQVEWVVTDSPLCLGQVYADNDTPKAFGPLLDELFLSYDNINIFLVRKKSYAKIGRMQTEEEAKAIDAVILDLLNRYRSIDPNFKYYVVDADRGAVDTILNILTQDYGLVSKDALKVED